MKKVLVGLSILVSLSFSAEDICYDLYKVGDNQRASDCYVKQLKENNSFENNFFAAVSLSKQGRYKEALPYLQKAEQLASIEGDLAATYSWLAVSYSNLGNSELELAYDMKFLNNSLKGNNKKNISTAYNNLGSYYQDKEDYNKALEYYNKSLEFREEKDKATNYNNIALIYDKLENYDKASEFYNKAIELNLTTGNYLSLCNVKTNFGAFQYKQKKYLEADKILSEANSICHNASDISNEANSLIYLGYSAIKQNNLQLAKSYYDRVKPLVNKSGNSIILGNLKDLENKINSAN